jgi:hypothetical protein
MDGWIKVLLTRSQAERPTPPVDSAACRGVGGVPVDVSGDIDRAVPEQVSHRFGVYGSSIDDLHPNRSDPAGRDSRVVFSFVVVHSTTWSEQVSIHRCG